jgi:hypothetical protein
MAFGRRIAWRITWSRRGGGRSWIRSGLCRRSMRWRVGRIWSWLRHRSICRGVAGSRAFGRRIAWRATRSRAYGRRIAWRITWSRRGRGRSWIRSWLCRRIKRWGMAGSRAFGRRIAWRATRCRAFGRRTAWRITWSRRGRGRSWIRSGLCRRSMRWGGGRVRSGLCRRIMRWEEGRVRSGLCRRIVNGVVSLLVGR